jgi:integrase
MRKSTRRRHNDKPDKPYHEFPLFAHQTKRWAKKIRGKMHYFGPWNDPTGALDKYLEQRDDLHAGRKPRATVKGFTLRDLCNRFLTAKRHLVDTSELRARTFNEYFAVCEKLIEALGADRLVEDLRSDDFEELRAKLARGVGPVTLANLIQRARVVFKFAADNCETADKRPIAIRYGQAFKRPAPRILRRAREAKGGKMFEAAELRTIIAAATQPLKTMILLGINCGFGNHDCGRLPLTALDLKNGWVDFARPKTEIPRRCPLWPETAEALREVIARRPAAKDPANAGLVFLTKYGASWFKEPPVRLKKEDIQGVDNPIAKEMAKLLKQLGLWRAGRAFYALRHCFETIGGESLDQVAVDAIMGHAPDSGDMSAHYRERISDERRRVVADHVRAWLLQRDDGQGEILPYAAKAE